MQCSAVVVINVSVCGCDTVKHSYVGVQRSAVVRCADFLFVFFVMCGSENALKSELEHLKRLCENKLVDTENVPQVPRSQYVSLIVRCG